MAVVVLFIAAMALIFGMAVSLANGINLVAVISLCIGLAFVAFALVEALKAWRHDH
jgi:hypothetical protein